MNEVLIVNGLWGVEQTRCCIINVYAPCYLQERVELWDMISIILGDFNSIRSINEREGTGTVSI